MSAKNSIKNYQPKSFYHVFNRGAFKENIYKQPNDYWVFRKIARKKLKQLGGLVKIDAFSLLPNHYHFLLYQHHKNNMEHFMRSILTSYAIYFCRKHQHSGHIFEGPYKAILLESKQAIWNIRKYILSNPAEAGLFNWPHVGRNI